MKITILVDNYATQLSSLSKRLLSEWGGLRHMCMIIGYYMIRDLRGTALLNNMRALGIDLNEPEYLVISHRHIDHTGGVRAFLNARSRPIKMIAHTNLFTKAYATSEGGKLEDISVDFTREYLESRGGVELILIKEPYRIANDVIVSGEIPRKWGGPSHTGAVTDEVPDDMALYIKHPNGLIALTGCGHSGGVENIVEYGFQVTGLNKLYAVIGGLHFMGLSEDRIRQVTNYLANKSPSIVIGTTVRVFLVLQPCTMLCQGRLGLVVLVP